MDEGRAGAGPRGRVAARALGALLVAASALVAPALAPAVAAAEDELRLEVVTTYTLDPAAGVVRGRLEIVATNQEPNRVSGNTITQFYFDELRFPLPAEAEGVRASSGGRPLTVRVAESDEAFVNSTIRLRSRLLYRQTVRLQVDFQLPGGLPRSTSPIRVGKAFSTYVAWAYGDPGRSTVRLMAPTGLVVETAGANLRRVEDASGMTVHEARAIPNPDEWYSVVTLRSERDLTRADLDLDDRSVTIRAWPEDAEWLEQVSDVLARGLPELDELIGLPWPVEGRLNVVEVHTPLLEGYAGLYYTDLDRIEISEDLDDATIVHEAAHAWFNDNLYTGRWITEGLAEDYAGRVLERLQLRRTVASRPFPQVDGGQPLNAWRFPGRIDDEATNAIETYGYNASSWILRQLVDEVGEEPMRAVFGAAERNEIAWVGAGAPEKVGARDDWRRFLDLLEARGGSTIAEDLFRRYVVTDRQAAELDERAEAVAAYRELVEVGDGWRPPIAVREPLAEWQFDRAETRIDAASAVLELRDEGDDLAASLGVTMGPALRLRYESAEESLGSARDLARAQLEALMAVAEAEAVVARQRDPLVDLGLLGAEPSSGIGAARAALEAGRLDAAVDEAERARGLVDDAPEVGRERVLAGAATAGGLGVLVIGTVMVVRRRRASVVPALAYATLAASSQETPDDLPAPAPPEPPGPQETGGSPP